MLTLVLVNALHLHVEQAGRIDDDSGARLDFCGQRMLVGELDGRPRLPERGIVGQRLQPPKLVEVRWPGFPDGVEQQAAQPRVDEHQESAWGHAVGHARELVRPQVGEVAEGILLEQFAVQTGDAIDGVAADAREVGHTHVALPCFVDDRQPFHATLVSRERRADVLQVPVIDLVNDLEEPRQRFTKQRHWPFLKRFRQERVVRVPEGAPRDVPGRRPVHTMLVDEQTHQLGDADSRMRVVQLNRKLLMKAVEAPA